MKQTNTLADVIRNRYFSYTSKKSNLQRFEYWNQTQTCPTYLNHHPNGSLEIIKTSTKSLILPYDLLVESMQNRDERNLLENKLILALMNNKIAKNQNNYYLEKYLKILHAESKHPPYLKVFLENPPAKTTLKSMQVLPIEEGSHIIIKKSEFEYERPQKKRVTKISTPKYDQVQRKKPSSQNSSPQFALEELLRKRN